MTTGDMPMATGLNQRPQSRENRYALIGKPPSPDQPIIFQNHIDESLIRSAIEGDPT